MPCNLSTAGKLRLAFILCFFAFGIGSLNDAAAQPNAPQPGQPTEPKARKTFAEAEQWAKTGQFAFAVDAFRKANEQDGGHCGICMRRAMMLAQEMGDLKLQELVIREWLPQTELRAAKSTLHFQLGVTLERQGQNEKGGKQEALMKSACDEFHTALELDPTISSAHYGLGMALAYLEQDDAARAEFSTFLKEDRDSPDLHERAARFADRVDLARARMAPPFELTTLDGQRISIDSLAGKVVLIDFWATWCGPCREALPHVRRIAEKFQGQPFVVLSVSLDKDRGKWKDFVAGNGMTWPQYYDGYFNGPIAKRFAVSAIPSTFSIDADGVLKDQHVGDENIDGELKKMIARAAEPANRKLATASSQAGGKGN